MRLALVCEQLYAPVPGGTGRYTAELLTALRRTATSPDSVSGYAAWHRGVGSGGVKRLALPRRPLIAAWERGLPPTPRGVDVVHAPTLLVPSVSVPCVVTIHDAVPWTHPETLTARGVRWHRRMADRIVSAGAMVAVPTHAVAAELGQALPELPPSRVRVLGAGATPILLQEPPVELARDVGRRLQLPERYLLSLATLEPRKGLDTLLEALAQLGDEAPALLLVGQNGWGGIDVAATAARLGLAADRVRQLGRLSDADLAVVLRRATALAVPSRAEGFGLPVVEAMGAATAVVISDAPALVEVAGGAALVAERENPADLARQIARLFGDEQLRTRLVAAGRTRAATFTWDEVANRCWMLYRELV